MRALRAGIGSLVTLNPLISLWTSTALGSTGAFQHRSAEHGVGQNSPRRISARVLNLDCDVIAVRQGNKGGPKHDCSGVNGKVGRGVRSGDESVGILHSLDRKSSGPGGDHGGGELDQEHTILTNCYATLISDIIMAEEIRGGFDIRGVIVDRDKRVCNGLGGRSPSLNNRNFSHFGKRALPPLEPGQALPALGSLPALAA